MKKFLSFLLAIVMIVPLMCLSNVSVSASTDSQILSKINTLYDLIGNTYFNVDHSTGCGAKSSGHGCENCLTSNIVNATWFKNLFGTCSTSNFANSYGNGVEYTRAGYSCLGFANFAEWYIFKTSNSSKVSTNKIGTYNFNYSNISSYALVGDILRLDNSHSVIYISADSSGIYVLDCNYGTSYNCMVRKHTIPYSNYSTFTISRATNRTVTPTQYNIYFSAPGATENVPSNTTTTSSTYTIPNQAPRGFKYTFYKWDKGNPGDTITLTGDTTLDAHQFLMQDLYLVANMNGYSTGGLASKGKGQQWFEIHPHETGGKFAVYSRQAEYIANGLEFCSDTVGALYDANGNQLATDDDSGEGRDFKIIYDFKPNTTYYLAVNFYSASDSGGVQVGSRRVYTIKYSANGGSGAPSSQTKENGFDINLSSTKPTRTGYTFLGWSTSSTATSATYQPGGNFTSNADTTLYAVWEATTVSGTCGDNLTWTLSDDGELVIDGTGEMNYYSPGFGGTPWNLYRDRITKLTIRNGVTNISAYAFYKCTSLTSVTIPNSVRGFGINAFAGCSSLASITIPDSVKNIGDSAFYGCYSLANIKIPTGITIINNDAFHDCSSLTSITIPDSVKSIGNSAFAGCSSLTSITIPDSVKSIGNSAFASCSSLTSVTIPDSVTIIGDDAFGYCTRLTSVAIGNGIAAIGDSILYNSGYYNNSDNWENGVLYAGKYLVDVDINAISGEYSIKEGTLTVANSAFYDCTGLTSVNISDSVTNIGSYTFHGCEKLVNVTIPDSVTRIDNYAFSDCDSLAKVTVYSRDAEFGTNLFDGTSAAFVLHGYTGSTAETYASDYGIPFEALITTVTSITLSKSSATMNIGDILNLTATVSPSNATNNSVTWASSAPSIATVTNGTVTALKSGTTTITATTVDGSKTATCAVTVEDVVTSYEAYVYTEAKRTVTQGSEFTFKVSLAGTYDGYSFAIVPPSGMSITEVSAAGTGIYIDEQTDRWLVSVLGGLGKTNPDKEEIVTITVLVDSEAQLGTRELSLTNVMISNDLGDKVSAVKYEYATIEITDQIPGDINGDGGFDYYDVSKLFAFYRGKATLDGAIDTDINGDGTFDYYDVSKLFAIYRGKADFN